MSAAIAGPWPSPLIICAAPNGARKTHADHAALPVTIPETARAAAACRDAGAAMLHLHVRDRRGAHVLDAAAYRDAIAAVRAEVGDGLVIQITTEAVGVHTPAQQMACVRDVRPQAASIALRELIPDDANIPGAEAEAAAFLAWRLNAGVHAQYILYEAAEVDWLAELSRRGVVPDANPCALFVLGRYARGQRSTPADLLGFVNAWRANGMSGHWFVCAFGRLEHACALTAAALGGHSRVGFENNVHLRDGSLAPDNAALVAQAQTGACALGRPLADAAEARRVLGVA